MNNNEDIKPVVPKWVSLLMLVLCIALLVWNICDIIANKSFGNGDACTIVDSAAVLVAIIYCITGFKKSSAWFFKGFLAVRLISAAIAPLFFSLDNQLFQLCCSLAIFLCLVVFAIALNIGKKYSYMLSIAMIVLSAVSTLFFVFTGETNYIGIPATNLLLSVVFFIMVYAKYKDKEARGSK